MRLLTTAMAAGLVLAAVSGAYAVPVTITNPGFEFAGDGSPIPTSGNWVSVYSDWNNGWQDRVQGWTSAWFNDPSNHEQWGGQSVTTDTGWTYGNPTHVVTFGDNNWSSVSQMPAVNDIVIQAGTYTLGLDVCTSGHGSVGYSAGFDSTYANNLSAASVVNSNNFSSSAADGWSTVVAATLTVPEGSDLIGQRLGFYIQGFSINSAGDHVMPGFWPDALVDNVTLDFAPAAVPEPASLGILAGAGLLTLSRRRRSAN